MTVVLQVFHEPHPLEHQNQHPLQHQNQYVQHQNHVLEYQTAWVRCEVNNLTANQRVPQQNQHVQVASVEMDASIAAELGLRSATAMTMHPDLQPRHMRLSVQQLHGHDRGESRTVTTIAPRGGCPRDLRVAFSCCSHVVLRRVWLMLLHWSRIKFELAKWITSSSSTRANAQNHSAGVCLLQWLC